MEKFKVKLKTGEVVIGDKFDNTDSGIVLLFSVPKSSYHKDANDTEMSGKHLAQRVKTTLEEMGMVFADEDQVITYEGNDNNYVRQYSVIP